MSGVLPFWAWAARACIAKMRAAVRRRLANLLRMDANERMSMSGHTVCPQSIRGEGLGDARRSRVQA
jgi:predicted GNAT family acetyltransferase